MIVLYNKNSLSINTTTDITFINETFDSFIDVFGLNKNVTLSFIHDMLPTLSISPALTTLTGNISLHILNPFNDKIDSILIKCSYAGALNFKMNK